MGLVSTFRRILSRIHSFPAKVFSVLSFPATVSNADDSFSLIFPPNFYISEAPFLRTRLNTFYYLFQVRGAERGDILISMRYYGGNSELTVKIKECKGLRPSPGKVSCSKYFIDFYHHLNFDK